MTRQMSFLFLLLRKLTVLSPEHKIELIYHKEQQFKTLMLFTLSSYHFWIKSYAKFSAARYKLVIFTDVC